MKIGGRTVNNALFSALGGLLPLPLTFICWPYIVSQLGDSSYGILALVGTVIGYFALLDLGMGQSVVKYISEYTGRNDARLTRETAEVSFTIFMTAGLLGSLAILCISRLMATRILNIPDNLVNTAYIAFNIASLGFIFTMLMNLFTSIANGLNRYDISSTAMLIVGIATPVLSVVLLRLGFGLTQLVWLNVTLPALTLIGYGIIVRRLLPCMKFRFTWNPSLTKRILTFGMYSMLSRIGDIIMRQAAPLIIGSMLSVASVTYYIIPFTILNKLATLVMRTGMVIFPAVSELNGQTRQNTIRELYLISSRIIISFSAAFIIPLLIFGSRFLHLWMSPEFAEKSGPVLQIVTVGVFIDQFTNIPVFVVDGLGHPKISGLAAIVHSCIFLGVAIPGSMYFGVTGVAAAFTISAISVSPFFIWYVNTRILKLHLRRLITESYIRPLSAGAITALILILVPQKQINNLFLLLGVMGAGSLIYLVTALIAGVYQQRERQVLMDYIQRITARFIPKLHKRNIYPEHQEKEAADPHKMFEHRTTDENPSLSDAREKPLLKPKLRPSINFLRINLRRDP